ncbi:MAG: hypothetical protein IPH89_07270 [Bacteroidetes bacterium]|nr:hypothetical protein [Bacteroidota bacterium]
MSQLHALVQTLSDAELSALHSYRLIGKEKNVFDFVLKHKDIEMPSSDDVLSALKISDSHYYKINSVLLRKSYQLLVPSEGLDLLVFLRQKNLFTLLRHEILTQEKKLDKTSNKEEFYLKCFHFFIDFPYKFYDKKLTNSFGEKYLKSKKNSTESDKLYVKFHILFSEINRTAARKNPIKALGFGVNDLLKQEAKLVASKHYLATYYLYRCICSYYTYYEKDTKKIIEYLKKAISLKEKIAFFFPINIGLFLELLYDDALLSDNQVEQACSIYSSVFEKGIDSSMYGYYFHCEQYILVLVIQKQFEKAQQLLDDVFEPCIKNKIDIYATRGSMAYVKLYLSNGDLKSAQKYLNIAKVINEKTFYLPFDVQLRVLENIYFFLKKDYDFAYQLATRNIKFVRSQEQNPVLQEYVLIWRMITTLINTVLKEEKISEAIITENTKLNQQYSNLYCNLIQILLERAKA